MSAGTACDRALCRADTVGRDSQGRAKKNASALQGATSGKGRTVTLSATVVEALRAHRTTQAEQLLQLGFRTTVDTDVCTVENGDPLRPNTLTLYWKRLVKKLGLPVIRFHDLRHACATHMLTLGVHPKVASERLDTAMSESRWICTATSCRVSKKVLALVDTELQAEIKRNGRNSVAK